MMYQEGYLNLQKNQYLLCQYDYCVLKYHIVLLLAIATDVILLLMEFRLLYYRILIFFINENSELNNFTDKSSDKNEFCLH